MVIVKDMKVQCLDQSLFIQAIYLPQMKKNMTYAVHLVIEKTSADIT